MIHLIPLINFFHRPVQIYTNYDTGFPRTASERAWKFYPRNTRVNIGPPIIPAGEKIKFRILAFETRVFETEEDVAY